MSIIKSYSVGNGDMFYIKHNTDNFTIIDCCLTEDNKERIVDEIIKEKSSKTISRFISTHPDEDHIQNLDYLDDKIDIINFYCVKNSITSTNNTTGFNQYCTLRDSDKAFNISKDCSRKWMNKKDTDRGSSGLFILWPDLSNQDFIDALENAEAGGSPNNISPIILYRLENGINAIWMGDLENDFMEKIEDEITLPKVHLLFAPHHGRQSGKVITKWLEQLNPDIVIIGEAASKDLNYYQNYNTITQNTANDIQLSCEENKVHIYVSNKNYSVDFLDYETSYSNDYYIGTLNL